MGSIKSGNDLGLELAFATNGKVILTADVTLRGLGGGFVLAVAQAQPSILILASRNLAKIKETAKAVLNQSPFVRVLTLELDLVSSSAVRKAADTVNVWADVTHIDVLVNNAGVMAMDWALSPDGYGSQLATNH
ncbi:hypothetical protein F5Y00DRAFT_267781 [Daldinia vernicosa]|uniref:uncharacterized protein n=1 Tax=Daldinia vernicosa TaxID=114800 RepID=UPI002007E10E|nr:uncharacterized protein F5Y00DRAFT_267781 [Daldinia vernicosa]KAI0843838.1 hypothetical protein F5Y00DRAFT_267781 [Daldinia vernicosa]